MGKNGVELTAKGASLVGPVASSSESDLKRILEEYSEQFKKFLVKNKVSKRGVLVYDVLSDRKAQDKNKVAKQMGCDMSKLSGFEKDLNRLSALRFLKKVGNMIQLTDKCFPFHLAR